jgi:hypothetical protein
MNEQQIFNTLVEFFEEDDWDFQWVSGLSVLSMSYAGRNGNWMCFAQARESQQQFVFYSTLPVKAPEAQLARVAEFITRVNYGMIMGNFELDYVTGEIRYKTSLDIEGTELNMPLIRQVVYANLVITDHYLPGMMRVLYSDVSPLEALAEVELDEGEDFGSLDDFDEFDDEDDDFGLEDDFDDDEDDEYNDLDDDLPNPFADDPPGTNGDQPE